MPLKNVRSNQPNYPENTALSHALAHGVSSDIDNRSLLFAAILAADLIVPSDPLAVCEVNDVRELLVFTDLSALQRFFKDIPQDLQVLSSRVLCQHVLSDNLDAVILNVGGPVGYRMPRWEVEAVAQGHVPQDHPVPHIQIGRYDALPIPKATIATLAQAVAIPEVNEVYWHWIRTGESKPQICISISPVSPETVLALQTSIRQAIPESIRQQNPILIRGLDEDPQIAALIREHGQQLYPPQGAPWAPLDLPRWGVRLGFPPILKALKVRINPAWGNALGKNRALATGIFLLILATKAMAADSVSPLTPDRPGFTNGADTVLTHMTQIELGVALTNFSSTSGAPQTLDFPEMLIRTGLKPHLELRIGLPNDVQPKGQSSGYGDANVGIKYQTYVSKDGNTKFALIPALTLPTGNSDFGSGHVDPLLTLAAQTTSGARWGLSANLQMADPTQSGTRTPEIAAAFSSSYQMTSNWSAYADLYDNFVRGDKPSPIADGGLTYLASSELQYDAEIGFGLGGSAPVRFIGAGVSLRVH